MAQVETSVQEMVPWPVSFAAVTGSFMWGLSNPESDVDVRGIYVAPISRILSLDPNSDKIERNSTIETTRGNLDLQMYEIRKACLMLLAHNGNTVEMLLSPTFVFQDEIGARLRKAASKFVTKRLQHYYKGYANSQRERAAKNRGGKALIYSIREMYCSLWLMRTGKIIYDFRQLRALVEGENIYRSPTLEQCFGRPKWQLVNDEEIRAFWSEWDQMSTILDYLASESTLPESHDGYDELNGILLDARRISLKEAYP